MRCSFLLTVALGALTACGSTAAVRTGDPSQDLLSSDPIVVRAAYSDLVKNRDISAVPLVLDNLAHKDSAVRAASYSCFLELMKPRFRRPVEMDRASEYFGYSFAIPPSDSAEPIGRIRRWNEHYTGDTLKDLRSPSIVAVQLACVRAAEELNYEAIPILIENLRHDSVVARAFSYTAFVALVAPDQGKRPEIVHRAFGYEPGAPPEARDSAVSKIEEWLKVEGRKAIARKLDRGASGDSSSSRPTGDRGTSDN